ncbi:MAG TPA: hypothetical protein VMW54_01725 [Terriglobia bacterium]|nr:hypothetical protein [Terriglobia bacterium]
MNKEAMGLLLLASCLVIAELPGSPGPQPSAADFSTALTKMLRITWTTGPDLPQGFQDSSGGIVDNRLVTVDGFCSGQTKGVVNKPGKYPRGFLKKAWSLNLEVPESGWQPLPDFPGTPRQGLSCISVKNKLYCWGGFSYSAPFCYRDGYELSRFHGRWEWNSLPELPWHAAGAGICAIGPKIYWMGGADYDREKFYTDSDRSGDTKRLGARLLVFNTESKEARWKELPSCPGTPRWDAALAAVNGKIYAIGGATGNDNPSSRYCTVVDNWEYDPARHVWKRLPDTPIASGNFPSGRIVFENRYILLIGGFQYKNVLEPSGTPRPPFGSVFRHYRHNPYDSDVFVYDTLKNEFGKADPLPLNNNGPMTVLQGSQINLIGGETGGAVIDGEYFGHHPDLYLIGKISSSRP